MNEECVQSVLNAVEQKMAEVAASEDSSGVGASSTVGAREAAANPAAAEVAEELATIEAQQEAKQAEAAVLFSLAVMVEGVETKMHFKEGSTPEDTAM